MNSRIGIIKMIDSVGRLVIPKDMRARFDLKDEVELIITEEGILLRAPSYKLTKIDEKKANVKELNK